MADHELIETLRRLRYDLTGMQGKVSEALRMAGSLNPVENERLRCNCGLTFGSLSRLAEHVYTSHGGPVPAHWVANEALTDAIVQASVDFIQKRHSAKEEAA